MNVSIVSVSRRAGPPHCGQSTFRNASSRVSGLSPLPLVVDGLGQQHRQLRPPGTGTMPQSLAVDDRDRRAPVALAADQPVAQPVGDRRLALARAPPASSTIARQRLGGRAAR